MGKCKNESVGGNTNEFIRFKEKTGAGRCCMWYCSGMPRSTWKSGKHGILYCMLYPRYGRSNGTASGGSGTVCKT